MKLLILLFLLSTNICGQHIGFTIEGTGMVTDATNRIAPVPTGLSVLGGLKITDDLNFEARIGYGLIPTEYSGWDFSGVFFYDVNEPVYFILGITHHANEEIQDEGVRLISVSLIGIGASMHVLPFLSFEMMYNIPLKKEEWIYHHDIYWKNFWSEKLVGVIKANLKFHWKI